MKFLTFNRNFNWDGILRGKEEKLYFFHGYLEFVTIQNTDIVTFEAAQGLLTIQLEVYQPK